MNNDLISREALKKAIEELEITEEPVDYDCGDVSLTGVSQYLDRPDVLDLIDNAPTVNPFFPISEEVFNEITDAEWQHSDSFWITTPSGKKIEFEKKRPQAKWIKWNFRTFGPLGDWDYKCSNCEKVYYGEYNFCPNCGATMRKDGTE